NLLTNAAKYTPPGGHITVTVRKAGTYATIAVADDGTGIDNKLLPRVFDLFVQGRQDPDRPAGGLGLGLTLVRSLVMIHGGTIEARSDGPGCGSTFTVTLPILDRPAATTMTPLAPSGFPAMQARRILIVDDNDDARTLLGEILSAMGHDVQMAGDGPAAIELVRGFHPELAILDIGLPVMDGYELAVKLRDILKNAPPRLIAVTGYGQGTDVERSRVAGFDRHLVKPVELRRLLDCIGQLTRT
ncbi:MAG TPA: ATP-binding protein, partial [Kofleriaceae bacterium]|nr:ATP-binding protein [Kofleriaceae bacterium]